MTKVSGKRSKSSSSRHQPLGQVITEAEFSKKFARRKDKSNVASEAEAREGDDDGFMDDKTSRRIYDMSREQREEEERVEASKIGKSLDLNEGRKKKTYEDDYDYDSDDSDNDDGEVEGDGDGHGDGDGDDDDGGSFLRTKTDDGYVEVETGLSEEEERAISKMMGEGTGQRKTLADVFMEKMNERVASINNGIMSESNANARGEDESSSFPRKVVDVYTDIGNVLSRYKAGKLPKAFKVIPSLSEWEEILYMTRPDMWTPQAMYAATRIFASNLNPRMAQRFYNLVLLDAVRADIYANKKLNYHYYESLKKSVYKPAAFFKGILIPLAKDNCTLREATIVSSVLSKVSIPVAHSAVALQKISELDYSGGQAIFIRCLLDKKYSLPMPVIRALVNYFTTQRRRSEEPRPVLWHQALLTFAQRYKDCITDVDKSRIRAACKVEFHHQITKEVRRELFGAKAWNDNYEDDDNEDGDGDVSMS